MKLIAKNTIYGVKVAGKENAVANPGDSFEIGDVEGHKLVAGGFVILVSEDSVIKSAPVAEKKAGKAKVIESDDMDI